MKINIKDVEITIDKNFQICEIQNTPYRSALLNEFRGRPIALIMKSLTQKIQEYEEA